MRKYRRNLGPRDGHGLSSLPTVRFAHECVWACHLGTDDPDEFGRHLAECLFIAPQARELAQSALAAGRPVCISAPPTPKDRDGQLGLPGTPKAVTRGRK